MYKIISLCAECTVRRLLSYFFCVADTQQVVDADIVVVRQLYQYVGGNVSLPCFVAIVLGLFHSEILSELLLGFVVVLSQIPYSAIQCHIFTSSV